MRRRGGRTSQGFQPPAGFRTVSKYTVKGDLLRCIVCGHDDFLWHQGLKESRGLTFFGFDWAAEGVDKLTCAGCAHVMTFARITAENRPQASGASPQPLGAPRV